MLLLLMSKRLRFVALVSGFDIHEQVVLDRITSSPSTLKLRGFLFALAKLGEYL